MTWPPPVSAVAVIAVVSAAVVGDLKNRRIPNALTLGAAVVAVAMHAAMSGWPGLLLAASGWAVGAALFFPLFALGGMAAGDVKLLAAIGAWLGPAGALWTALYGAVAGGVMALVVALSRGYASTAMRNVGKILRVWSIVGVQPVEGLTLRDTASPRLPYALPLAAGALVTLWMS
ncbi:MAG TPA: prepilin peptidase [Vicinamibacterales bacterium]|nr:prepilin peptidase [Vicinamibacterales bacterium]